MSFVNPENQEKDAPYSIIFGSLTSEQIKALSTIQVTKETLPYGKDYKNTTYDGRLGAIEFGDICETCGYRMTKDHEQDFSCPGHFGYLPLCETYYNISFLPKIFELLKAVCPDCSSIAVNVINRELIKKASPHLRAKAVLAKREKVCYVCSEKGETSEMPEYKYIKNESKIVQIFGEGDSKTEILVQASRVYEIFKKISDEDLELFGMNCYLSPAAIYSDKKFLDADSSIKHAHQVRPESWLIKVLLVIPPRSRMHHKIPNGQINLAGITEYYHEIIKMNRQIEEYQKEFTIIENGELETNRYNKKGLFQKRKKNDKKEITRADYLAEVNDLQQKINDLINRKNKDKELSVSANKAKEGIFNSLKTKSGYVRFNLIGKRGNSCARSVINSGPYLQADEVGVPDFVAKVITIPVTVKASNLEFYRQKILNGEIKKLIDLNRQSISIMNEESKIRSANNLKPGWKVRRFLQNGDYVLFGRQPTIRTESMMGLKVVLLENDRCFRLNLPVCGPFNADFDGDEMNLYVPQSLNVMAECSTIMSIKNNIVAVQNGKNIISLVQDAPVACWILTNNFEKPLPYHDKDSVIVVDGKSYYETTIDIEIAAICFKRLRNTNETWSEFLERCSVEYKEFVVLDESTNRYKINRLAGRIPGKMLISACIPKKFNYKHIDESDKINIVIKNGVLARSSSPFDKRIIGSGSSTVILKMWQEFSQDETVNFISNVTFLTNEYLSHTGFSVGMDDCYMKVEDRKKIKEILSNMDKVYYDTSKKFLDKEQLEIQRQIQLNMTKNDAWKDVKKCIKNGDRNSFIMMEASGAKGSKENTMQIVALTGQQNVSGGRIPLKISNGTRTLPHFKPYDESPLSRGFIYNSLFKGLNPIEMFFYSYSGRAGAISTNQKTSEVGYQQRLIGKKLEDLVYQQDGTVRVYGGKIVQFIYGSYSFSPKYLYKVSGMKIPFFIDIGREIENLNNSEDLLGQEKTDRVNVDDEIIAVILNELYIGAPGFQYDIIQQKTNELRGLITNQIKKHPIVPNKIVDFFKILFKRFHKAKVQPGECVGLKATNSISEPNYQATMNVKRAVGQRYGTTESVQHIREMTSVTSYEKQKNPAIQFYSTSPEVIKNNKEITELKKIITTSENQKKIDNLVNFYKAKNSILNNKMRPSIPKIIIGDFIEHIELFYVGDEVKWSKLKDVISKPKMYEEDIWVKFYKKFNKISIQPNSWVIRLNIKREIMFNTGYFLEDICNSISEINDGIQCIPSPLHIGKIDLYVDFFKIIQRMKDLQIDSMLNYRIVKSLIETVKSKKIDGIEGIAGLIEREIISTGEFIIETTPEKDHKDENKKNKNALVSFFQRTDIDLYTIETTNIQDIEKYYGIETARTYIFKELEHAMNGDGFKVSPIHLNLLCDMMTLRGSCIGVSAQSLVKEDVGCLSKNLFQNYDINIPESSVRAEVDRLTSYTGSMVMSTIARFGTNNSEIK